MWILCRLKQNERGKVEIVRLDCLRISCNGVGVSIDIEVVIRVLVEREEEKMIVVSEKYELENGWDCGVF